MLDQIQGNITPGFRKDHQAFLFFRFPEGDNGSIARGWLKRVCPLIASAEEVATFNRLFKLVRQRLKKSESRAIRSIWLNVAFSDVGLKLLGINDEDYQAFPAEFHDCPEVRADKLGELAESQSFEIGGTSDTEPHALLIIGADTRADLEAEVTKQCYDASPMTLACPPQIGQTLGDGFEHFGFRDGISQPDPDDPLTGWPRQDSEQIAPPGEFILGLPKVSMRQGVDPWAVNGPTWARFGSFLVFRKLEQDVSAFRQVVREAVAKVEPQTKDLLQLSNTGTLPEQVAGITPDATSINEDMMAARFMGRWPSGIKLTFAESQSATSDPGMMKDPTDPGGTRKVFKEFSDVPEWQKTISADEIQQDQYGDGCPLFSHIGKAHPRSAPGGLTRNRIIRRGIPYGPVWDADSPQRGEERGLLFLAYQASIKEQFQKIQSEWLQRSNRAGPARPGAASEDEHRQLADVGASRDLPGYDPIAGTPASDGFIGFHLRGGGQDIIVSLPTRPAVTVRGTGYFFSPSIAAIEMLAEGHV